MKHHLMQLTARIRAICIVFALLPLFAQKASAWSEVQVQGAVGSNSWSTIATLKQGSDANTFSGTIDASSWTSGAQLSFKLYDGKDDNTTYWWGNGGTADMTSNSRVTLPGATTSGWNMTLKHSTNYSSYTLNCTFSDNSWTITITGVSSSGGSSTAGDETADKDDKESTTAGYGVPDNFGGVILRYNSKTAPTAGNLFDWKDYFSVAYLTPDSKGFKSTFAPYFNYLIKDVASHKEVENGWDGYVVSMSQSTHPLSISAYGNPDFLIGNWSNSTSWTVGNELNYTKPYLEKIDASHAGMLDFPLRTFMYNIEKGSYADASARGWQALTYLSQIAPNNNNRSSVIGSGRNSDALYNRLGVTFVNNDKVNDITGVENIKKAYAVILTSPGTPVVNYSDLANSNLNDDILRLIKIRQWAGIKNTSKFQNKESREKNHAYVYHIQGDFAELKVVIGDEAYVANYEKGGDGDQITGGTKDRNSTEWGGESYSYTLLDEGTGWRVWYNNKESKNIHVALSPESGYKTGTVKCTGQVIGIAGSGERNFAYTTDGTAPVLNASNTKTVTYTWNSTTQSGKVDDFSSTHATVVANGGYVTVIAQAIKDGKLVGALDTVTYRFNDYVPLNVKLTPPTATVPFGTSLTPKVEVVGKTNVTDRMYAFTLDGSTPVINTKTGAAGNELTHVITYTPDAVVPTSDLGTFYMTPGNVLAFIDRDGNTTPIPGTTTVTVKVQAVYAVGNILAHPEDNTPDYYLEGNIATGVYTFEPAGAVPGGDYTLTVTNKETVSVNKVVADVKVTNKATGKDDDVDVYYTTDGSELPSQPSRPSDPNPNPTEEEKKAYEQEMEAYGQEMEAYEQGMMTFLSNCRLVRNRKITIYAKPGDVSKSGTIKVFIINPNDESKIVKNSCNYDLTYSTSEGGYLNYQNNKGTGNTIGGDGHVVVYVQPYSSDKERHYDANYAMIYAYEKLTDGSHASLNMPRFPFAFANTTTVNGEKWYYFDLEPAENYKEVCVQLGYGNVYSNATVANACKDMFLKFDMATRQITDVTHAYTGDHFYTTGTNGTKTEAANPVSTEAFIYVQVPAAWVTKGNSVKVFYKDADNKDEELSGATVKEQGAAETSDFSRVCKITGLTSITDGTQLTIKPYNGSTASSVSFTISYQNGGYYFYESPNHYSTTAPLVFSPDADTDKNDYRSKGPRDINHVTKGDKTHYLANSWTYSPETESKTKSIDDNWNKAASATVNVIPSGTTISQTVNGLSADSIYTVQMIVRGKSGAKGTMTLEGATTTTDELNLTGYNAQGVITSDGRVEYLLNNDANKNGWQKLEASVKPATDGTLTVKLTANGEEMQLSDVTLLENANTKGHVWTTAPTSNTQTEFDLSSRATANAFSFFDRGKNRNAIIYANDSTVLGMSENTYDVAVAIPASSPAKAIHRAPSEAESGDADSETSSVTPKYSMHTFAITDQAQDGTTASGEVAKFYASGWNFGTTKAISADVLSFDRSFSAGVKAAVCFPFTLTQEELEKMFGTGAMAYNISLVDAEHLKVNAVKSDAGITANVPCLIQPGTGYTGPKAISGKFILPATSDQSLSVSAGTGYTFEGTYDYKKVSFNDKEHCYSFDPTLNGRFKYVSKSKGGIIKPFRAYIKEANTVAPAKVFRLVISDFTTGINSAEVHEESADAPIYSLTGVMVSANGKKDGLSEGVYIQNGKKFIITK